MAQMTFETILTASDGSEIFMHSWLKENAKATILVAHGLGEHSGSYWMLAQGLQDTPYQLMVCDLRGHGRSSGKRGVATIDEYVDDFHEIISTVRKQIGSQPLIVLGHSMGGLILLKYLVRHAGHIDAVAAVLSSPLLGVAVEVPVIKKYSANLIARLAPNLTLHNELNYNYLSHDPACIQFHNNDTWRHDRISARLYLSMMESIDYVFKNAEAVQLPLLLQVAGEDRVVSTPQSKEFFRKLTGNDKTIKVYDGFYHEIYNEKQRQIPISDLTQWIGQHL